MNFHQFAEYLQKLEQTSGRNDMTGTLAEFINLLDSTEIRKALYLLMGRLVPEYVDLEFNMSTKMAQRALLSDQYDDAALTKMFKEMGDMGLVAEYVADRQIGKESELQIIDVYDELYEIAKLQGTGSQEQKVSGLTVLFGRLDGLSARYVARIIIGKLRLGLSDKTILDALSWAKVGDKTLRKDIERAFGARADIGYLAEVIKDTAADDLPLVLSEIKVTPGTPVASKLVEREKSSEAVFERLGSSFVQPKLDGLRAQIHIMEDGQTIVFSRNMENLTVMLQEIADAVRNLKVKSAIIDSEAIGYDYDNGIYLSYQETMSKARVSKEGQDRSEEVTVRAMAFDLLYLDGQDITQLSTEVRVQKLREIISNSNVDRIALLETVKVENVEHLEEYFQDQIGAGLEGVIIKDLEAPYEPGTRNYDWIKLKANTQSHLVDNVDTVVMGYFFGEGARAKFGIGKLLVGVYDPEKDKYYSVAKVGSGVKDEEWPVLKADLEQIKVAEQPTNYEVDKMLLPDVWVAPEIVSEVTADEITRSPAHTAAREVAASFEQETKGKGLSLRFPRLKIWRRDKKAEQATTVGELVKLFELRKGK